MIILSTGVVKMKKSELIKLADYLNIVNILIEQYSFTSLFKIEILSMMLYSQSSTGMEIRKTTNNRLYKFFENLHSIILSNYLDFIYISKALKINEKVGNISINGDFIFKNKQLEMADVDSKKYLYKENIADLLSEINLMSIDSFTQEVLANV